MGILPQRGVEETPCGQISQLEVCQLLIAGTQVAYPVGLNGYKEPIIISLPEPLANGASLTAGKPIYLEIDIPSSPAEELDQKVPPIGKVSTIVIANPHKFTPQIRWRGQHDHGGKESPILSDAGNIWLQVQKLNSEEAKPSGHPYTSTSQAKGTTSASAEMAEASLEGIPTSISPNVVTSRSRSVTPPAGATELWENANKALKELLTTKASIDTCRQRAIWELVMELHWNES